jgi:uroporphyrinogen III methyltransferase/synthase
MKQALGKVVLAGAGPGDPGLISLKAAQALAGAQAVVHDRLVNPLLLDLAPKQALRVDAGKLPGDGGKQQSSINARLIALARQGLFVVRLKGGDPFTFARGGEEGLALKKAGIAFEVIPGISSGLAALSSAGIPLTHRGLADCAVLATGHKAQGAPDLAREAGMARLGATLVYYMGVENAGLIARGLLSGGLAPKTPAAVIERGTWPDERVLTSTLGSLHKDIQKACVKAPAILVVGQVVSLRKQLQWKRPLRLQDRHVLVFRSAEQAGRLSGLLQAQGARVTEMPLIRFEAIKPVPGMAKALACAQAGDYLAFTSATGVGFFFRGLHQSGKDSRALAGLKICAMGPGTAQALAAQGLNADLVPKRSTAEGLALALKKQGIKARRVLVVRPLIARSELALALEKAGAKVLPLVVYRTLPVKADKHVVLGLVDKEQKPVLALTSGSVVSALKALFTPREWARVCQKAQVASLGPITTACARAAGLKVVVESKKASMDALVKAIR